MASNAPKKKTLLLRRRVLRYVKRWIKTRCRNNTMTRWDGQYLRLDYPAGDWGSDSAHFEWSQHLVHDVSHYRTCSNRLRRLPEFGLGAAPFFQASGVRRVVSARYAEKLERRATILDILVMLKLRFDFDAVHEWWVEVSDSGLRDQTIGHALRIATPEERRMLPKALPILYPNYED